MTKQLKLTYYYQYYLNMLNELFDVYLVLFGCFLLLVVSVSSINGLHGSFNSAVDRCQIQLDKKLFGTIQQSKTTKQIANSFSKKINITRRTVCGFDNWFFFFRCSSTLL